MSQQGALTVVVEIEPERLSELRALLESIGDDVNKQAVLPFSALTTVHFIRWVILEDGAGEGGKPRFPPQLAMETNFDGPLRGHLREVVEAIRDAIDRIYGCCVDYPGRDAKPTDVVEWIVSHKTPYAAFYVGARGRSARRIRDEARLYDAVQGYLDGRREVPKNASTLVDEIRSFVRGRADLRWALDEDPPEDFSTRLTYYAPLLIFGVGVVAMIALATTWFHRSQALLLALGMGVALVLGVLVVVAAVFAVVLLYLLGAAEEKDEVTDDPARDVRPLVEREDNIVQNQLSHLVDMKPGPVRAFAARVVFTAIDLLARYVFVRGNLGGIPSIHFARWVFVDGGQRLLFFSNFDGSWESYLGDFIDRASLGLTAVWSNTRNFPRTQWRLDFGSGDHWLFAGGACDEERFKRWTRNHQIRTQAWYSAYPTLSIQNVNNNSRIRDGIAGNFHDEPPEQWLQRFA